MLTKLQRTPESSDVRDAIDSEMNRQDSGKVVSGRDVIAEDVRFSTTIHFPHAARGDDL
jgi:hypothetical protein